MLGQASSYNSVRGLPQALAGWSFMSASGRVTWPCNSWGPTGKGCLYPAPTAEIDPHYRPDPLGECKPVSRVQSLSCSLMKQAWDWDLPSSSPGQGPPSPCMRQGPHLVGWAMLGFGQLLLALTPLPTLPILALSPSAASASVSSSSLSWWPGARHQEPQVLFGGLTLPLLGV